VRTANTVQRLRVVGQRIKRSLSAIEGDVAAFRLVQTIRMRRQLDSLRDGGDPNRIDPYALDELQQRILRESLRQAASLQERLRLDYRP
jgi:CBS domain-containing protein